jgi:hypothetical protein
VRVAAAAAIVAGMLAAWPPTSGAHPRGRADSVTAIRTVFGKGAERASRVARCESKLDSTAANLTDRHSDGSRGSWGLFQIGSVHRGPGESVAAFRRRMTNPAENARVAYRLSQGGTRWAQAWRTCGAGL